MNILSDTQTETSFIRFVAYNADGNLLQDGRWNYVWDAENRLMQMTMNSGVGPQYQLTFTYDPQGRRIQKAVTLNGVTTTTRYLYDGWNLIATLNPQSSLLASYLWGNDLSGTPQGAGGVGGLLAAKLLWPRCAVR